MEEDEDVIIEGGVLHSYLKDSGCNLPSFETLEPIKKKTTINEEYKPTSRQQKVPCWVENHLLAIMRSGLLFDDHSSFVEAFQPVEVAGDISSRRTYVLTALSWTGFFATIAVSKYAKSAAVSLVLQWISLPIAFQCTHVLRKQREKAISLQNLQEAILKLEKLFAQLKKCILMVQEAEAILSKFKLPGIELVEFRKSIRQHLKEVVYYLSDRTETLTKDFPLDGKVDATAYRMSKADIEAALLPDDHDDAYTIGTLKRIFNIYLLVQSEFLRRLALCYCPDMWLTQTERNLPELSSYYIPLAKWSSEVCRRMEKSVKIYEAFSGTYERKAKMKGASVVPGTCSDIYIAVRSSSLHLQSVLARSRDLEESLETDYCEADSVVFLESLLVVLKDMQKDLRTSQVFLDDALVHVLKTKNSVAGLPLEEGIDVDQNKVGSQDQSEVKVVKDIELNPPVEDEVFEAVIKREANEDERQVDEVDLSLQEEQEQKEREKQKSLKVLSELKVVLKEKASEWKERERVARQKKGCSADAEDDAAESEEASLDWLPTANAANWPLPRLKDSISKRKKNVQRSVSSKSEEPDEEENKEPELFLPGTAFNTLLLAEAKEKSLLIAGNRPEDRFEDTFGDSEEEMSE